MNDVSAYIEKQRSPQKEVCEKLREIILETFPGIKEEMKWGVPAFGDGLFYIVALKEHVNLGFSIEGLSKEQLELFDGGGKTTRHIKVSSMEDLDRSRVIKLLEMVGKR